MMKLYYLFISATNTYFLFIVAFCSISSMYDYVGKAHIHMFKLDDLISITTNVTDAGNTTLVHAFRHRPQKTLSRMQMYNASTSLAKGALVVRDLLIGNIVVLKGDKRLKARKFVNRVLYIPLNNIHIHRDYEQMVYFIEKHKNRLNPTTVPTLPPMADSNY